MPRAYTDIVARVEVTSFCPFVVESISWQPRAGLHALTVVVKATYRLMPGISPLAEQQDAIVEYDNHWNDDPSRSLYCPSDLVPFKPRADVSLVGYAFSPTRDAISFIATRLTVATIDKRIDVSADHIMLPDGTVRELAPFIKMPMRYERAAHGTTNPVGVRHEQRHDRVGISLPNLQIHGRRDEPAGLGPIAPMWPSRAHLLPHTIPDFASRWAEQPIPEQLDPRFFNSAPHDQQVDSLHPDERIVLEALHPEYPHLETNLIGVYPQATIERAGVTEPLRMTADTLWIDSERGICTLTWRGQTRLSRFNEPGRVSITMAQPTTPHVVQREADSLELKTIPAPASNTPQRDAPLSEDELEAVNITMMPIPRSSSPLLPFSQAVPGQTEAAQAEWFAQIDRAPEESDRAGETMMFNGALDSLDILPFGQKPNPNAPIISTPERHAPAPLRQNLPVFPEHTPQPAPPPLTIGQMAAAATAVPAAMTKPDAPAFFASSVATAHPLGDGSDARPNIGSVAALRETGKVPAATPMSAHDFSNSAAQPEMRITRLDEPAPAPFHYRTATPVEVLWFDETFVESIRNAPRLAPILAAQKTIDDAKAKQDRKARAKPSTMTNAEPSAAKDIATILSSHDPNGPEGLNDALRDAIDERGTFTPPLVFMGGTLEFPFDELETLRATVAAIAPISAGDKRLTEMLGTISNLLQTPWLHGAGSERLTKEIKEAFASASRMVPANYLEMQTERILLEKRHYQKRTLLGQPWIRAVFVVSHSNTRIPAYLPQPLARDLPMFQRFAARIIVEARLQLDQYETTPTALRVVALGRVLSGLPIR